MEETRFPDELLEVASKRDDPNYQQISGHIPKEMATEFKIACTRKGVSHSDGLSQAIALWLAHTEQPTPDDQKQKQPPAPEPSTGAKGKGKG